MLETVLRFDDQPADVNLVLRAILNVLVDVMMVNLELIVDVFLMIGVFIFVIYNFCIKLNSLQK